MANEYLAPRRSARNKPSAQQFQLFKSKGKTVLNVYDLLPGLNDISDAFEALPIDIVKYFTLLKEIDAKCISTTPQINMLIERYIKNLHRDEQAAPAPQPEAMALRQKQRLSAIKTKIQEVIPCLEEKMHVTSVAKDLINKHMVRINGDYKVIVSNNEIPELIRIGPLNHPAMTNDTTSQVITTTGGRLELRREALAARKAAKEDDTKVAGVGGRRGGFEKLPPPPRKEKPTRPGTPTNGKKRRRRDDETDDEVVAKPATGNEPTYCYCNQVSFGKMVGCDGDDCKREWFHLSCIGFSNPPKGKWYCDECLVKRKVRRV